MKLIIKCVFLKWNISKVNVGLIHLYNRRFKWSIKREIYQSIKFMTRVYIKFINYKHEINVRSELNEAQY